VAITATDTILGAARGSANEVLAVARAGGANRLDELERFLNEAYRLAPLVGIDPAIVVVQSALETYDWSDRWWSERLNPAGIGITGDPKQNAASMTWASGADSARGQIVHLWLYARGRPLPDVLAPFEKFDPRASAIPQQNLGSCTTLADLGGKWAVVKDYGQRIANRAKHIFPNVPDQDSQEEPPVSKPYILLVAGHRSFGDGGNDVERQLTDDMAVAYFAAFRAAGYEVHWFQRDLDGDQYPDMTTGGLDGVALGVGKVLAARPSDQVSLMLDLHYNGPSSPIHAIVPDTRGLRTAYRNGTPADDNPTVNLLDNAVAGAWAKHTGQATGYSLFRGYVGIPGVMGEKETGVGIDGFRLAMMAATAGSRDKAVRLVLEHGGYNQSHGKNFSLWAKAAVAAVNEVFEVADDGGDVEPPPSYADPMPITGLSVDDDPDTARAIQELFGEQYTYVDDEVEAVRDTPRFQYADPTSDHIGPVIPKGTRFNVKFLVDTDEHGQWYVTKWWTRVRAEDVKRVKD
jgi:hypothetical protein